MLDLHTIEYMFTKNHPAIAITWAITILILYCGLFWFGRLMILFTPPNKRWKMFLKIALLPLGLVIISPLYDVIFYLAKENYSLYRLCSFPAIVGVWTFRSAAIDYHKNLIAERLSLLTGLKLT